MTSKDTAEPIVVNCSRDNDAITTEIGQQQIGRLVAGSKIIVLKGAFSPELMDEYREALMRWADETPVFPHGRSPSQFPEMNYHRIDDGSVTGACPHIFHQFGFNSIGELQDYIAVPSREIAQAMCRLQNEIAGTEFQISTKGLRLKTIHYPSGAGFLAEHTHPLEPQRVGLIVSLSQLGKHVRTGAACFETPFGRVDTTRCHDIGDIVIFRYDLPHEVTLTDAGRKLDWKSPSGKWSV